MNRQRDVEYVGGWPVSEEPLVRRLAEAARFSVLLVAGLVGVLAVLTVLIRAATA